MGRISFDKKRDVSFKIQKSYLKKLKGKFVKPFRRCLFQAIKRLMQSKKYAMGSTHMWTQLIAPWILLLESLHVKRHWKHLTSLSSALSSDWMFLQNLCHVVDVSHSWPSKLWDNCKFIHVSFNKDNMFITNNTVSPSERELKSTYCSKVIRIFFLYYESLTRIFRATIWQIGSVEKLRMHILD